MKFYKFLCQFVKIHTLFTESLEKGLDKVVSRGEKNFSVHNQYMNFLRPRKTALDEPLYKLSAGRSMVEMLGVLAIIGVLSVGAIAGYSKAMSKYRLNKFSEQLNTLVSACIRYSQSFNNLTASQTITEYFIKMGEIPSEMIKDNSVYIYDIYNRPYYIYYYKEGYLNLFSSGFGSMSDSTDNFEICNTYINIIKANSTNINFLELRSGYNEDDGQDSLGMIYGDTTCSDNKICLNDLQLDDIYEQCRLLLQGKGWQINVSFI